MAALYSWLTVTPVVSGDSRYSGETGSLPDVVARYGSWSNHDAYVVGPTDMAKDTVDRLTSAGVPEEQIHIEDFGWREP